MKSVCCTGRNRSWLCVPLRNPFPEKPPEPTAIFDWRTWYPGLSTSLSGFKNVPIRCLLVVLQEEPAAAGEDRDDEEDRDPALRSGRPPKNSPTTSERQERQRETQVRLQEHEQQRHADDRPELEERGRPQPAVVLVLEEIRDEKRGRDLRELGRLELEAAERGSTTSRSRSAVRRRAGTRAARARRSRAGRRS